MFTARVDLDREIERQFIDALLQMTIDNPDHRPILEAEGLRRWIPADTQGYGSLEEACRTQGLFRRPAGQAI
jgi:ABC-type phosphate/phosphonate transport system substrate-binding protein